MRTKQQLIAENPFYGMTAHLSLFNDKKSITNSSLDRAFAEIRTRKQKELFHIINFAAGDIVNRQHNIFGKKKIDKGGESLNTSWMTYLTWLLKRDHNQFIKFLPLIVEYVGLRELLTYQVRTSRGKGKLEGYWGLLKEIQNNDKVYQALLDLLVTYVKGSNPFYKIQVAKFTSIPKFKRVRSGGKVGKLKEETLSKLNVYQKFNIDLSNKVGWEIEQKETYKLFTGLKKFRSEYGKDLEYVLFSTGKILDFDQVSFQEWLNKIPAGGRYRVQKRIFDKDGNLKNEKYTKLFTWWKDWEKGKEEAIKEVKQLQEKAKSTDLSIEEKMQLKAAEKAAKVNTGSKGAFEYALDIINGKGNDIDFFNALQKQDPLFNCGIILDDSGSMQSNYITLDGKQYRSNIIRDIITVIMLYKQNYDKTENLLLVFGTNCQSYDVSVKTTVTEGNRFVTGKTKKVFVFNPEDSFINNYNRIKSLLPCRMGSTDLSSVSKFLKSYANESLENKEQLISIPLWIVVSDGDLNNFRDAWASYDSYQSVFRSIGVEPVTVMFHCQNGKTDYFKDKPNTFSYTGFNLNTISTTLSKLTDLDIVDSYTPLKGLFESNRYDLIKEKVI